MNGTVRDIVTNRIKRMPVEITEGEAELFNAFPTNEVVAALQALIEEHPDSVVTSRAFDALLKLDDFDKVQYLIDLYDESPVDSRLVACRNLARFQEKRVVEKLCEVILHDDDSDVRFCAVEALASIGDETAIHALEHVQAHDKGKDYEERRVADMAGYAIEKIYERRKSGKGQ